MERNTITEEGKWLKRVTRGALGERWHVVRFGNDHLPYIENIFNYGFNIFTIYWKMISWILKFMGFWWNWFWIKSKYEGGYSENVRQTEKKWFFRSPGSSISRMTKLFGVRRDQISSYKPPMLDYTCGEHVVNTRWLNVKKCSKNVDFYHKNHHFLSIFSHLINACWPHVHRTCNPTFGAWRNSFDSFLF